MIDVMKAAHKPSNHHGAPKIGQNSSHLRSHNEIPSPASHITLQLDLDARDKNSSTLLHVAARNGALETSKYLRDCGMKGHTYNDDGHSPFSEAIAANEPSLAKLLIDRGEAHERMDTGGDRIPSLHLASNDNMEDVVDYLLSSLKLSPNSRALADGWTPVHVAAQYGHTQIMRKLLRAGGNADAVKKDGVTPLYLAASAGHLLAVKELLASSPEIDPNPKTTAGYTPLHAAAENGHIEVLKFLLGILSERELVVSPTKP